LAHLCLSMLKSGESYNPSRVFMPIWERSFYCSLTTFFTLDSL
jgi:hypothetical protein